MGQRRAAFFDVDGTLLKSNIVMPFVLLRTAELKLLPRLFWVPFFAMQCAAYKLLDRINRSWFQTLFYTNYKGRHASFKRPFAEFVHREYLRPRVRPQAREEVARLKREGYIVVLVTGSLDFLVRPLAMALGADVLIGARLEEDVHAVLTGRLDGEPVSDEEKAVRMRELAEDKGIDLQQSTAFGDGFADLPMLEAVGEPVAVNSDGRLASVARKRGWRTVRWAEPDGPRGVGLLARIFARKERGTFELKLAGGV